jgi:hypothetical protein
VEALVYTAMVEKLAEFRNLQEHRKSTKVNPKLTAKQAELAKVEAEIEKLDVKRRSISQEIAALTTDTVSQEQLDVISNYLDDWDNVSLDDKRHVADGLISRIKVLKI